MTLPAVSQNISKGEIKTIVNDENDTLVVMHIYDAMTFLSDLLECELNDTLVDIYVWRDSVNNEKIILKDEVINVLKNKLENTENIVNNLTEYIKNTKQIIKLNRRTINSLKKEVRKHKREKVVAIITSIVLPIITALVILF